MSTSNSTSKTIKSYKPALNSVLISLSKDELIAAARQLHTTYSKLKKSELIEKLHKELLNPDVAGRRFAIMPDENIAAFESALERKRFRPTDREYALLTPFISMGYIADYQDESLEAVKEARTLYKKINTEKFQKQRQKLSWLLDCLTAMNSLHLVLPVDCFCKMYNQREGFELTAANLPLLLAQIPASFNTNAISGDKILYKRYNKNDFYDKLEQKRQQFSLYLPTIKEINMLVQYGYLHDTPAYTNMYNFFVKELKLDALEAHHWCQYIYEYENFNTANNTSALINKLSANIPAWSSYTHLGPFAELLQEAHNTATRMIILGGHTPNEIVEQYYASQLKKTVANTRVGAKAKKIYPNDPCPCGSGKKYKKCCGKKN